MQAPVSFTSESHAFLFMPTHHYSASFSPGLCRILLMASAVVAALAGAACSNGSATDQQPSPPGAQGEGGRAGGGAGGGRAGRGGGGPVPVVTTHAVTKAVPVTIPAVGTAEPLTTVQVRAQVTGQLSDIHFSEGQEVRKGAPLFTLDARPFEAALQQAQAVLARDSAQAKNAQSQRTRAEDLFKRGLIPREQYETQTANATALEATLAADQAQVENARLNLQYTKVLAPITGRTGALGVHVGDLVRANDTTPLIVINQLAPIYVTFAVPGRYLPDIRKYQGQRPLRIEARVTPGGTPGGQQGAPVPPGSGPAPGAGHDAGGREGAPAVPEPTNAPPPPGTLTETGTVSFIDNTVDPTTGTIKLKGIFGNADHALWPGLFVQVTLVLSTNPSAIVVPAMAVQTSQAGQYVFVVKQDRSVEQRTVSVQRQQGDDMVIAQGLSAGEEVVTDGHLRLTPGARVTTGTRGQGGGDAGGNQGEGPAGRGTGRGDNGGSGGARRGNRGNPS